LTEKEIIHKKISIDKKCNFVIQVHPKKGGTVCPGIGGTICPE
jgi:hypothetical protein